MIQRGDHLQVAAAVQRQDEVTCAERWVQPAVAEPGAQPGSDALDACGQALWPGDVAQVIESHPAIVAHAHARAAPGCVPGAEGGMLAPSPTCRILH